MSLVQSVGKIASAVATDIANPSGQSQTNAGIDIKQAALELVMPKLDAETISKYVGKWSENVEKDLKEKEEQERLAKEEQLRRQNLGLEKKEESLVTANKEETKKKDGYSVTDYLEASDAAARVARNTEGPRSNEELLRERILQDKERIS